LTSNLLGSLAKVRRRRVSRYTMNRLYVNSWACYQRAFEMHVRFINIRSFGLQNKQNAGKKRIIDFSLHLCVSARNFLFYFHVFLYIHLIRSGRACRGREIDIDREGVFFLHSSLFTIEVQCGKAEDGEDA
jgi:hypothetical protein